MTREEAIKYGTMWLKDEFLDVKDEAFIKIALEALKQKYKDAFTDIEKRIFYAAIGRERNICKYTDEEWDRHEYGSPSINLESVCNSIERKVTQSDLWRVEVGK